MRRLLTERRSQSASSAISRWRLSSVGVQVSTKSGTKGCALEDQPQAAVQVEVAFSQRGADDREADERANDLIVLKVVKAGAFAKQADDFARRFDAAERVGGIHAEADVLRGVGGGQFKQER